MCALLWFVPLPLLARISGRRSLASCSNSSESLVLCLLRQSLVLSLIELRFSDSLLISDSVSGHLLLAELSMALSDSYWALVSFHGSLVLWLACWCEFSWLLSLIELRWAFMVVSSLFSCSLFVSWLLSSSLVLSTWCLVLLLFGWALLNELR